MANTVNINGKSYDSAYANDVANQEEMRLAVVNSNNKITNTNSQGNTFDNVTGLQAQAPKPTVYDPTADIKSMNEYRKTAAIAGLGAARDSSLSNLAVDRAAIQPKYFQNREQTSTASQLGAKNLAEYMANRGQSSAGASMQGEINRGSQLQTDIGNWNTQEQGAFNSNTRDVTNTNNAYNSDVASSNANIEAQGMQQLIDAQNQMRSEQLAQANADRTYDYGLSRDAVTDTGKNADGTYTQQGQSNATAQQIQAAQLAEITNPNSTTNQMNKLGLDTAKLNFAALPAQLKAQAQQIAVDFQMGVINIRTAQAQLNALPALLAAQQQGLTLDNQGKAINNQYAPGLAQAQINASNASTNAQNQENYGSFSGSDGGGGSITAGSVPAQYVDTVNSASKKYGVPPEIVASIIQNESGWNASIPNSTGDGGLGLGQFMPATAKAMGLTDRTDPIASINAVAKYLRDRIDANGGDLNAGIRGYNGSGPATITYLNKILGTAKGMKVTTTNASVNNPAISKTVYDAEYKAANTQFAAAINKGQGVQWLNNPTNIKLLKSISPEAYNQMWHDFYKANSSARALNNQVIAKLAKAAHNDSE